MRGKSEQRLSGQDSVLQSLKCHSQDLLTTNRDGVLKLHFRIIIWLLTREIGYCSNATKGDFLGRVGH